MNSPGQPRSPAPCPPARRRACAALAPWLLAPVLSVPALAGLAGCASKPPRLDGRVVGGAALNPSVSRRPSPVMLRIYELRAATLFTQLDFMALFQRDQAELAADLLSREEFMLAPGETRPWGRPLHKDTRHLGVIAVFRDLEKARWRAIAAVRPGQPQKVLIRADALDVSVELGA